MGGGEIVVTEIRG